MAGDPTQAARPATWAPARGAARRRPSRWLPADLDLDLGLLAQFDLHAQLHLVGHLGRVADALPHELHLVVPGELVGQRPQAIRRRLPAQGLLLGDLEQLVSHVRSGSRGAPLRRRWTATLPGRLASGPSIP